MERTKRFFQRHRRGFAITAVVVGAGYLAYTYIREKIKEVNEATSTERSDRENLRRRFIQNQQDCMFNVLALYPNMAQQILEELRVESILAELQQKRVATTAGTNSVRALSVSEEGDESRASMITTNTNFDEEGEKTVFVSQRKTKKELWNELKITSLVRTLTLLYSLSALVLLSRIQFNLLGRQAYVASVLALAPESRTGQSPAVQQIRLQEATSLEDLELQRSFLSFSWWLVHRGWRTIMTRVHAAVEDVFTPISPKDVITPETFRTLLAQVRQQIDFIPSLPHPKPHTFLSSLLPPTPSDELLVLAQDSLVPDSVSPDLRLLLDETSDILESPAAMSVVHTLLDCSVEEFVSVLEAETKANRDGVVRLANYLPVATKEAEKIAHGVPNRYFQLMEEVKELSALAAIVYGNWDSESLEKAGQTE